MGTKECTYHDEKEILSLVLVLKGKHFFSEREELMLGIRDTAGNEQLESAGFTAPLVYPDFFVGYRVPYWGLLTRSLFTIASKTYIHPMSLQTASHLFSFQACFIL